MTTIRTIVQLFLCLAFAGHVSAQYEPGQWVGDLYHVKTFDGGMTPPTVLVDENNKIHATIPNLARAENISVPANLRTFASWSYWHGGALYSATFGADEKNEDGSTFTRHTFARWEDGEWHHLCEYKDGSGNLFKAIPCDNDRFIVISNKTDLTGDNSENRSPFVRMSLLSDNKGIKLDFAIDHGQDDLKKFMTDDDCFKLAFLSKVIKTDTHAVLINPRTGLYWIFSLEKATLVESGNIFRKVTPEMIMNNGFPMAVLCANPEKDGTVLVAAQAEEFFITETGDAVKEMRELWQANPQMSRTEANKIMSQRQGEIATRNPFIVWYRIYPENGKVEKLPDAPEGGTLIREGNKNDSWRPMPDGSVKIGSLIIESKNAIDDDPAEALNQHERKRPQA